jgi:hypothetical protein
MGHGMQANYAAKQSALCLPNTCGRM